MSFTVKCPQCKKKFYDLMSLAQHTTIHFKEKPNKIGGVIGTIYRGERKFGIDPHFKVYLKGKLIDKVWHSFTDNYNLKDAQEVVKRGLVEHDGYDPNIVVKGKRVKN